MQYKIKKIILIFVYAFILNWIWENIHSYLYILPSREPITQYMLIRATFFDAIFITILGAFFLNLSYLRKRKWYSLVFGFLAAFLIEKYALKFGLWSYNSFMPVIPFLNTGLTPTIQLGLLSFGVLKFIDCRKDIYFNWE